MEGVGTYTLSTDSVELRALFVSFSSIVKDLKPVTDREWQTFATNGDFGPAIRTVGRAEKRLLVAACRELLQLATTGVVAAQQRIDANPKALAALRQLNFLNPAVQRVEPTFRDGPVALLILLTATVLGAAAQVVPPGQLIALGGMLGVLYLLVGWC